MKQNTIIISIIVIGLISILGIWNYRYKIGNDTGLSDGIFDGNHSGYIVGFDLGSQTGFTDGYDEGFEVGKNLGYLEGYTVGYETGHSEGNITGYSDGYSEGESIGSYEGYYTGIEHRSRFSTLRDPTYEEALHFIEIDDTDALFQSDNNHTSDYYLSQIRQNAAAKQLKCLWIQVEMFEKDTYFCAFNTTDKGMLYFNYRFDIIHELEIGKPCYDERYKKPEYDDTITKIIYIN